MDLNEKLDSASGVKHKGNQYFKVQSPPFISASGCVCVNSATNGSCSQAGRYYQAVIQYQRIVSWLEMECGSGAEQQNRIKDFVLTAHLNLALCFLRLKEFSQVVENCNKVSYMTPVTDSKPSTVMWPQCFSVADGALIMCLRQVIELDERNEKALYRRGEARLLRNEFSLAMEDFQQVLQVNSSNRAARGQISICQSKIKEHHEQDKRTYINMFQKFAERDAKVYKPSR